MKYIPIVETLNDIRSNEDMDVFAVNVQILDGLPDQKYWTTRVQSAQDKYTEISENNPAVWFPMLRENILIGKLVVLGESMHNIKTFPTVFKSFVNGVHYKISDNKYYPIYANNYITNDHIFSQQIAWL